MLHERQAELLELKRQTGNDSVDSQEQPTLNNQLMDDEDKDVNERESEYDEMIQVGRRSHCSSDSVHTVIPSCISVSPS